MMAILTTKDLYDAIHNNNDEPLEPPLPVAIDRKAKAYIMLACEKGPSTQIQNCTTAKDCWQTLANLYSPKGFTAEFLLLKEFFESHLSNFDSMEDFLSKIKYLDDNLSSKGIKLPKQVVLAYVLNNLTPPYEGLVTIVTQSFCQGSDGMDIENLFSSLIDESRRQTSAEKVLFNNTKNKNSSKITKSKYCNKCKVTTHATSNCWFLHPDKKPDQFKTCHKYDSLRQSPDTAKTITERKNEKEQEKALLSADLIDLDEIDNKVYYNNLPTVNNIKTNFILDSGSTQHLICDRSLFLEDSLVSKITKLGQGDKSSVNSVAIGTICFLEENTLIIIKNCLYIPSFTVNILSIRKLIEKDFEIVFTKEKATIISKKITLTAEFLNNMYLLDVTNKIVNKLNVASLNNTNNNKYILYNQCEQATLDKIKLFHERFGHKSLGTITKLLNIKVPSNYTLDCVACIKAKATNTISREITEKPKNYLDKVVIDICGPLTPNSRSGYRYVIFFLDSATRYLNFKLLKQKSEAYTAFKEFKTRVENQSNRKIKVIGTDNGLEFKNQQFKTICLENGIIHNFSSPYTPEQNGLIERINRTIIETTRALLFSSNLSLIYWQEAVEAAVYIYNLTPHAYLKTSPYRALNNKDPNLDNLKIWGSIAYYKDKTTGLTKLEPKAKLGILIGYNKYNYYILDYKTSKIIQTRDVKILEGKFLESKTLNKPTITIDYNKELKSYQEFSTSLIENKITGNTEENPISRNSSTIREESPDILSLEFNNNNKRVNSSLSNNRPNKRSNNSYNSNNNNYSNSEDKLALITSKDRFEPTTYLEASNSKESKNWLKACLLEINQLEEQETWDLVDLPTNRKALKGRWVFKIKEDSNNNITKYKARWVIKGFSQKFGLDYLETFANTTRIEIIRLLLFLAAYLDLEIEQIDFKNAFLNSPIDVEIYMEQPIGFEKSLPKVCRLKKALYGLKQAPRAWYLYLKELLKKFNFEPIFAEQGIFINKETGIILIVYVDDVLLLGKNLDAINKLKKELATILKVSNLGEAKTFLGIEIIRDRKKRSVYLKQTKYIKDILEKYNKQGLNPVSTPAEAGIKLSKNLEQASPEDIKLYQQYIGSLIYLTTHTRPDLAFSVYNCARHMSNPSKEHFTAVNRIFKYLNYTEENGLYFYSATAPILLGYTDADWGGDLTTRKSTTGYIFLFGNTPISWASKLQKSTALSSCEAEYMALKEAIKEYIYLISIYKQLDINKHLNLEEERFYLYSDNQPAIELANNPEHYSKTKHIDIQYHFVREKILEGIIDLNYIPTKEQKADIFTKALNTSTFNYLFKTLNISK